MTVAQNVAFGLAVRKQGKADQAKRVDELLDLVQLSPSPIGTRMSCRAGSDNGSRSRGRSRRGRGCSCSTNRSGRSTRGSARTSGVGSTICIASSA